MIIPLERQRQVDPLIVAIFAIFIPSLLVILRLIAKRRIARPIDGSDICLITALVWNIGLQTDLIIMVKRGAFGFHIGEVMERFGPDTLTFFFKALLAFPVLWNVATCFSKLSLIMMYASLIPVQELVVGARILAAFTCAFTFGGVLGALLVCRPLGMNWAPQAYPDGTCGSRPSYYLYLGIVNLLTDFAILVLPMPFIYNLRVSMRKRLLALGLFSVGFATCGVTIYRQVLLPSMVFADMPYSGVPATILSGLEPAVAISMAAVPMLKPLFSRDKVAVNSMATSSLGSSATPRETASENRRRQRSKSRRPFEELDDDIQLQPTKNESCRVSVSAMPHAR